MSDLPPARLPLDRVSSFDGQDARLLDKLLAEYAATGHSPTVECWLQQAAQRLTEFGQRSPNERLRCDAERIACAYVAAARLLQGLHSRRGREPRT